MNKDLLKIMVQTRETYRETYNNIVKAYYECKENSDSKTLLKKYLDEAKGFKEKYIMVNNDIKEYKEKGSLIEEELIIKYAPELLMDEELEEEAEEELEEVEEVKDCKSKRIIAGILGAASLFGLGYAISSCSNDSAIYQEQDESLENQFSDASDDEQVNERVDWYFDNYINKEYSDANQVVKDSVTKEDLADIIKVVNGEVPEGFEVNELINYNNRMTQMFSTYLSTEERTKNGNIGFIPTQYLFEDGSHEQKCAAEVDAVMEPLIDAINSNDKESYIKYATEFGELMRDQYYLVDSTSEHYNTRSIASYPSRIHLYGMAYAFYTETIMEYGISNNINICVPFCIDHTTGETVDIPLSKLMAVLEFVPMSQWDAVIQRSGLTVEQIKALGNQSTEDTMPVIFTRDAKEHYRENKLTLSK